MFFCHMSTCICFFFISFFYKKKSFRNIIRVQVWIQIKPCCGSGTKSWFILQQIIGFQWNQIIIYPATNHSVVSVHASIWHHMCLDKRKPVFGVCEQPRCRLACISAQSDQSHCHSLFRKKHIWTWYKQNFKFLASLCSWGDWFESRYYWKPRRQVLSWQGTYGITWLLCISTTFFFRRIIYIKEKSLYQNKRPPDILGTVSL